MKLFLLPALLLLAAAPAAGQGRVPAAAESQDRVNERNDRILRRFAECVVRSKPDPAGALLRSLPESREQSVAVQAIIGRESGCLSAERMATSEPLFRGAIAEAFVTSPTMDARRLAARPHTGSFDAFYARMQAADVDGLNAKEVAVVTARWFSRCVAREQPDFVQSLLRAPPYSRRESARLQEAAALFSACLPQGRTLSAPRVTMRGLLAEALYLRMVNADTDEAAR